MKIFRLSATSADYGASGLGKSEGSVDVDSVDTPDSRGSVDVDTVDGVNTPDNADSTDGEEMAEWTG